MTVNAVIRPLTPGIYAPIPTFFKPCSEDLDIETFKRHVAHIGLSGIGHVISGSMAEAHHLSHEERIQLIRAAREALDEAGLTEKPLIVGTGAGSLRETLIQTKEAAEAGADYAIVIPSGYYAGALSHEALKKFFVDVAKKSPIPVMIYNYPGAAGGIDMDSELIESIAREAPNTCGVKLTCGNVGKLTRITAGVSIPAFSKQFPRVSSNAPFLVFGGFADFILPSSAARGHGAIVGLGNVAPRTLARLYDTSVRALSDPSLLPLAQELQDVASRADYTIAKAGVAGTKYLLEQQRGYGGAPRLPLLPMPEEKGQALLAHPTVQALLEAEKKLEKEAGVNGVNGVHANGTA